MARHLEVLGLAAAGVEATASAVPVDALRSPGERRRRPGTAPVLPAGGFTDPDHSQVGLTQEQAVRTHPGAVSVTVPHTAPERAGPTCTPIIGLAAVELVRAAGPCEILARAEASTAAWEIDAVGAGPAS